MKKVRYGTFETNSSSTHSLVIPKTMTDSDIDYINDSWERNYNFGRDTFREVLTLDEKYAYVVAILTSIVYYDYEENTGIRKLKKKLEEFKEYTKEVISNTLNTEERSYDLEKALDIIEDTHKYLVNTIHKSKYGNHLDWDFYVDHVGEFNSKWKSRKEEFNCANFVDKILNDKEFYARYLLSRNAYIIVGSDEGYGYYIRKVGFEYDYEDDYEYMNADGQKPPKDWFDKNGRIKEEYFDKYFEEYTYPIGEWWTKVRKVSQDNDIFLKGN